MVSKVSQGFVCGFKQVSSGFKDSLGLLENGANFAPQKLPRVNKQIPAINCLCMGTTKFILNA